MKHKETHTNIFTLGNIDTQKEWLWSVIESTKKETEAKLNVKIGVDILIKKYNLEVSYDNIVNTLFDVFIKALEDNKIFNLDTTHLRVIINSAFVEKNTEQETIINNINYNTNNDVEELKKCIFKVSNILQNSVRKNNKIKSKNKKEVENWLIKMSNLLIDVENIESYIEKIKSLFEEIGIWSYFEIFKKSLKSIFDDKNSNHFKILIELKEKHDMKPDELINNIEVIDIKPWEEKNEHFSKCSRSEILFYILNIFQNLNEKKKLNSNDIEKIEIIWEDWFEKLEREISILEEEKLDLDLIQTFMECDINKFIDENYDEIDKEDKNILNKVLFCFWKENSDIIKYFNSLQIKGNLLKIKFSRKWWQAKIDKIFKKIKEELKWISWKKIVQIKFIQ